MGFFCPKLFLVAYMFLNMEQRVAKMGIFDFLLGTIGYMCQVINNHTTNAHTNAISSPHHWPSYSMNRPQDAHPQQERMPPFFFSTLSHGVKKTLAGSRQPHMELTRSNKPFHSSQQLGYHKKKIEENFLPYPWSTFTPTSP